MRKRGLIVGTLGAAIVVLGGTVAGLSAATSGKIAQGIRADDVQLGGLTPEQAKARLEREYLAPRQQSVTVERRGKKYTFSAKEARITADLDQTVRIALERSDEGNALTNAWRTVSGSHPNKQLPVEISSSRDAVLRFVDRVRRGVDRKPVNARLTFENDRPYASDSRDGLAVDRQKLRAMVQDAITDAQRSAFLVPVEQTKAKVTKVRLQKDHGTILTVDRNTNVLLLFKNFKQAKRYAVAVGSQGHETPAGTYTINDKQVNPSWHVPESAWAGDLAGTVVPPGPTNPIKARWMGFFNGAGIHGTADRASIGSNASHGCVRMREEDVIELFDRVPLGTTIHVV